MLDRAEFERWRGEASRALLAGRSQATEGFHNWACFMAEQAAQLAVKGFLHGLGRGPWGHDLVQLGSSLREVAGDDWPEDLDAALRRLSRHYIPARYPDAHPAGLPGSHYGSEDSVQALADSESVLTRIDAFWGRLLEGDDG